MEDLYEIAVDPDTPPSFKLKFHELLLKAADFEPKAVDRTQNAGTGFQLIINLGDAPPQVIGVEKAVEGEVVATQAIPVITAPNFTQSIAEVCLAAGV